MPSTVQLILFAVMLMGMLPAWLVIRSWCFVPEE